MNEQELGKEIARFLDSGAEETIKQSTLYLSLIHISEPTRPY